MIILSQEEMLKVLKEEVKYHERVIKECGSNSNITKNHYPILQVLIQVIKTLKKINGVLLASQRAIEDAMALENGLDSATGKAVLDMIDDYRKQFGLEKTEHLKTMIL